MRFLLGWFLGWFLLLLFFSFSFTFFFRFFLSFFSFGFFFWFFLFFLPVAGPRAGHAGPSDLTTREGPDGARWGPIGPMAKRTRGQEDKRTRDPDRIEKYSLKNEESAQRAHFLLLLELAFDHIK